jgi:hypothetical protein
VGDEVVKMKANKSSKAGRFEEIERRLREGRIVKSEPILAGSGYWGRAEAEWWDLVAGEEDPRRRQEMMRRREKLAVKLQALTPDERERALLDEIRKWKRPRKS